MYIYDKAIKIYVILVLENEINKLEFILEK